MSSRGLLTTFINKYLPLEISPENYCQHWWLRANGASRKHLKLEARSCAAAGRAAVKAEEPKREASEAPLR